MNRRIAIIISIAVLFTAAGFLTYTALSENMVYYYAVDEFTQKSNLLAGETIKINGIVAEESIRKAGMQYDFVVRGTGANHVKVTYRGVVPDTFREGSDVVVEGKYDEQANVFRCSTLLAKCPSKYEEKH